MGYQRVTRFCCDACGSGGRIINSLQDDSFQAIKDTCIACGWKVNDDDKFLCDECIRKGKTFDDCLGFSFQ